MTERQAKDKVVKINWAGWRLECMKELGFALFYMNYLYPPASRFGSQVKRVKALCQEVVKNRISSDTKNVRYWRTMYERIIDETENMC